MIIRIIGWYQIGLTTSWMASGESTWRDGSQKVLSDDNLPHLMRIAIEGPEFKKSEDLNLFKQQSHRCIYFLITKI